MRVTKHGDVPKIPCTCPFCRTEVLIDPVEDEGEFKSQIMFPMLFVLYTCPGCNRDDITIPVALSDLVREGDTPELLEQRRKETEVAWKLLDGIGGSLSSLDVPDGTEE